MLAATALVSAGLTAPLPVLAETIGISIPLSGEAAELGRKFRIGAKLAMEDFGYKRGFKLYIVDDGCDPELAELASDDLKNANPVIVTGLMCNDSTIAIANNLNVPLLVAGARSIRLIKDRKREEWNIWRMSPGDDYAYIKAAEFISANWRETPFAVVDDGTIYGRTFTDNLRIQLDELGTKEQFSDSFRAAQSTQAGLLRRLERSGVKAAFIAAATTEDLFTIARDMENTGVKLDLIVTEQLSILPFLKAAGEIKPNIKIVSEKKHINKELDAKLKSLDIEPDTQIYAGYAAIEVAYMTMISRSPNIAGNLEQGSFETVNGPVNFDENGRNTYNPYVIYTWDGQNLNPYKGN